MAMAKRKDILNFKVKFSSMVEKNNNSNLLKNIIKYIDKNKCCYETNCKHPSKQSNEMLHKAFPFLEEAVTKELNLKIKQMWCFYAKKNQKVEATWHSHPTKISAVLYLTDSNLCTIFNQCAINLRKNTWLLFNGKEMHTTQEGITNSDRLIIATDLCK